MANSTSRRNFLRTAPLAAAAVTLADATTLLAQATPSAPTDKFQLISAADMAGASKKLHAAPGNENFFMPTDIPLTFVLTVEEKKAAKDFEWHEGRDHIVQILEGECIYEVGGTGTAPRNTKPGEWLSATSTGSSTFHMKKGDTLIIPRNTLHKRTTPNSVTLTLVSTPGVVKS